MKLGRGYRVLPLGALRGDLGIPWGLSDMSFCARKIVLE